MQDTHRPPTESKKKKTDAAILPVPIISHHKTITKTRALEESDFALKTSIKAFYMALKR